MANAATNSPPGTDSTTASCLTNATEPIETIPRTEFSGVVGRVIPLATPDRNSPLSADEAQRLARIARDRANHFMVSGPDVDFLLDLFTRLSR
jgi:hypothetical protein